MQLASFLLVHDNLFWINHDWSSYEVITFANVLLKTWQWKPVENARIDETDLVLSLFLSNFWVENLIKFSVIFQQYRVSLQGFFGKKGELGQRNLAVIQSF